MKNFATYIILFLVCSATSFAQISPGDLASSHSHLEGISNCTKCHDLGKKVPNSKCLACHDFVNQRIQNDQGYHASNEVKGKDCIVCHSDHHGRTFDMMRFDEDAFDHLLTGYKLEGKHEVIDCRSCHKPDNIINEEIRERNETFLGLSEDCKQCHTDYHHGTLSNDCKSCHGFDTFTPADKFEHDNTDFALKKSHLNVDCLSCHPKSINQNQEFQQFSGIPHNDCASCHDDPHNFSINQQCKTCHDESRFTAFLGENSFRHNQTNFRLKGQHNQINCFDCHLSNQSANQVFKDKIGLNENQCSSCHSDKHEGKFGSDCAQCHVENSFNEIVGLELFNHDLTDFPLLGKHENVDCKACHKEQYSSEIEFEACNNCHTDYHEGEFEGLKPSSDCISCHDVELGFEISSYGMTEHKNTAFPLEGAHAATPCFECHKADEKWQFRSIPNNCVSCHLDIHEGYISTEYYPDQDCKSCHSSFSWQEIQFNHADVGWVLEGRHKDLKCASCHFELAEENANIIQSFNTLSSDCIDCHKDIHQNQFLEPGKNSIDCRQCHTTKLWSPSSFDHNNAAFPLEGKHREIDCNDCHIKREENGVFWTQYKMDSYQCIDCHQ